MTTILGLSGSLRRASFNAGLLRAAVGVAPEGVVIETGSIKDVPLYDGAAASQIERVQVRGQTRALPSNPSMGSMSSGGLY